MKCFQKVVRPPSFAACYRVPVLNRIGIIQLQTCKFYNSDGYAGNSGRSERYSDNSSSYNNSKSRFNRFGNGNGNNSNSNYKFRNNSNNNNRYGRSQYGNRGQNVRRSNERRFADKDEIHFDEQTLAKLIRVPDGETVTEVTLDQLKEEQIIDKELHKSIDRMGFPDLTKVQQKTIKPILANQENDVIARAKTGTGKTFAFLIPIFQHLINTKFDSQYMVKSVIVAPTRDLALQIEAEVKKIHKNNYGLKKYECVSLVGGTNFGSAIRRMEKLRPNIVIATPGRLMDVMEKYGPKFFKFVDFKVLDEADRLLEIGFKEDLEKISNMLNELNSKDPKHIRTLLFSATLDEKVQKLSNRIMNKENCLFIDTVDKNEPEAHEKIAQSMVVSKHFSDNIYASFSHIKAQIVENPEYKGILFTPTVKFTKFISRILKRELYDSLPVFEFHGQIDQKRRTNIVRQFKEKKSGLLICTDVGARGMDFPNVQEVLQIGLPSELLNYVHRIGRTARSGKEGASTLFISEPEMPFLRRLEEETRIVITNKTEFTPERKDIEEFSKKIEFPEDLSESLISLISFYRSCVKSYGLQEKKVLPDLAATYGTLLNEPGRKIPVGSRHFLEKLGLSRNPITRNMFEIKDRYSDRAESETFDRDESDEFSSRNRNFRNTRRSNNTYKNNNNYPQRDYSRKNNDFSTDSD